MKSTAKLCRSSMNSRSTRSTVLWAIAENLKLDESGDLKTEITRS
jgi:hypothetical protein